MNKRQFFLEYAGESITLAAKKLETAGAIRYRREYLTIVNRKELEKLAGDNYMLVNREYERLHEVPALR